MTYTIGGEHAIRIAERDGVTLTGGVIVVDPVGWTGPGPHDGYRVEDYFRGGLYLGPDADRVEPAWRDA